MIDDEPMTEIVRAHCAWEVVAGLIPEQPIHEHTRRYFMASGDPSERFQEQRKAAYEYAETLTNPNRLTWVRVEWVRF